MACQRTSAPRTGAGSRGRVGALPSLLSVILVAWLSMAGRTSLAGAAPAALGAGTPRVAPAALRLLNYYPATHPWERMWTQYAHTDTVTDFARIAALRANAVRIIVFPSVMGFVSGAVPPTDAAHLADMIGVAAQDGLAVQLTLFDSATYWDPATGGSRPYSGQPGLTAQWLGSLLAPYRGDPRIALVELENELDPYDAPEMAWAAQVLGELPSLLPGVPRTASTWGSSDGSREGALLASLSSRLDVLDAHLYGTPGENAAVLRTLVSQAAGRPVIVGEAGATSGTIRTIGDDEAQAKAYSLLREVTHAYGIAGFAPWTLLDLAPAGVPSWLTPPDQAYYGLIRTDGTLKPAARVVTAMFGAMIGGLVAGSVTVPGNLDGGFEREDSSPTTGTTLGAWQEYLPALAGTIGIADGQGTNGSRAAQLGRTGSSPSGVAAVYQRFVAPAAGSRITVTAQLRLVGGTGCSTVSLAWFAGDSYLGNVTGACADDSLTGWQRIGVSATVPPGVTEFEVYLQSAADDGVGYFDNAGVSES